MSAFILARNCKLTLALEVALLDVEGVLFGGLLWLAMCCVSSSIMSYSVIDNKLLNEIPCVQNRRHSKKNGVPLSLILPGDFLPQRHGYHTH